MTKVSCENEDCLHLDLKTNTCKQLSINIECGYEPSCMSFEHYLRSKEYKEDYFIVVKDEEKILGRILQKGKRVVYNGRVFYTRDREEYDHCLLTEERTGLGITKKSLEDDWETFIEKEKDLPDVMTYPLLVGYNRSKLSNKLLCGNL